ncbi:PilZ domain-containing protein [Lysobacter sp. TAF61]|uniref:PilZ domain-containing protein n=1 Tax=Lysobacter sp. TAF61 TaxID=3233072 RepID=UPI003F9D0A2C
MNLPIASDPVFGETLVCDEIRPAAFLPGGFDQAQLQAMWARGEMLLRALAVVEDGSGGEEPEQPSDHAVLRIEAKLDLLTALVASLATAHDADPLRPLRWSSQGACLTADANIPTGTVGRFRVQPADWLPSPLVLPATLHARDIDQAGRPRLWLRFGPLSPVLAAALERHLFRVHRRAVAESRRGR